MAYPDMGVILEVYAHMGTFCSAFQVTSRWWWGGGGGGEVEVTSKVSTWMCGLGFQKPTICGTFQKPYKLKMMFGYTTKPRPNVRVSV